jgi:hypothetical protein
VIDLLKSWLRIVGMVIAILVGVGFILGLALLIGVWAWSNLPWLGALIITVVVLGVLAGTLIWAMEEFV